MVLETDDDVIDNCRETVGIVASFGVRATVDDTDTNGTAFLDLVATIDATIGVCVDATVCGCIAAVCGATAMRWNASFGGLLRSMAEVASAGGCSSPN